MPDNSPSTDTKLPLAEQARATFKRNVKAWLAQGLEGQYVALKGRFFTVPRDTLKGAILVGERQFRSGHFVVAKIKDVQEHEPNFIDVDPGRSVNEAHLPPATLDLGLDDDWD